jgi:hypothetical protein
VRAMSEKFYDHTTRLRQRRLQQGFCGMCGKGPRLLKLRFRRTGPPPGLVVPSTPWPQAFFEQWAPAFVQVCERCERAAAVRSREQYAPTKSDARGTKALHAERLARGQCGTCGKRPRSEGPCGLRQECTECASGSRERTEARRRRLRQPREPSQSGRARRRREKLRQGLCGSCGARPRSKGIKVALRTECSVCAEQKRQRHTAPSERQEARDTPRSVELTSLQ